MQTSATRASRPQLKRACSGVGVSSSMTAGPWPAAERELLRPPAPAEVSGQAGQQHDQREGQPEREDRHEGRHRDAPEPAIAQRPAADAHGCGQHDRGHRRLDAIEHAGHRRQVSPRQVEPAQADQDEQRRQHEQPAGHDAAPGPVHQPADVGRELLGLRTRQHHAVVQRVQVAALGDPAPPLDQVLVHQRDLSGRPAEADAAQPQPVDQGLPEGRGERCGPGQGVGRIGGHGRVRGTRREAAAHDAVQRG